MPAHTRFFYSSEPYINTAFPAFMKQNGYSASAFFPTSGIFYNSRNAFVRYGFDDFFDWKDLGLASDWLTSDIELAEVFVKKTISFDDKKPFFS